MILNLTISNVGFFVAPIMIHMNFEIIWVREYNYEIVTTNHFNYQIENDALIIYISDPYDLHFIMPKFYISIYN